MFDKCAIDVGFFMIICFFLDFVKSDGNIALRKPARVSVETPRSPGVANDGGLGTSWGSGSCLNVMEGDAMGRWWQVDLQCAYWVETIKVTNRGDCCHVYDTDPILDPLTPARHCNFHTGPVSSPGVTVTVVCVKPVVGRFLRITQMSGYLQFCELQAFGKPVRNVEPCGWFIQNKGKRSSSSPVTTQGPEVTSRAECAEQCGRDVTCTGFNFQDQPVVTCQLLHALNGGSQVSDSAWEFYILNGCWRCCD